MQEEDIIRMQGRSRKKGNYRREGCRRRTLWKGGMMQK